MTAVSFFNRFRRRTGLWLTAGLLLFGCQRILAAPALRVFCDSAAWIGDSLSLKLQYEGSDPRNVLFPVLDPQAYPGLEFFSATPERDTAYDKTTGLFRLRASYPFAIYTAGTYAIPPVSFRVFENGQILIYDTDTLWINIYEPDVDTEQAIRDIKEIRQVSVRERLGAYIRQNYLWITALALVLAAAGFGWYYWRRKRHNLPILSTPKPPIPPLEQALADLRKLKAKQLWQQNRIKEYYTELTDILRAFLAAEYHIAAIEMTSDECLDALRLNHPDRKEDVRNLGVVFRTADLVKFAKGEPQPSEHEDCFRLIWRFVAAHKEPRPADRHEAMPETPQTRTDHELE
ncbi:MAG: hypothetical protein K2O01_04625 [Bacteroidales bacterium]|nr:hypothetical protein [Bacteroidales bacterium]